MDPHAERWPHVDIVREELTRLQAEKTAAAVKARAAHFAELKEHMSGYDLTRTRIEREKGKRDIRAYRRQERILRQTSATNLTQRMMKIGERIINEREANSPLGD